MESHGPAAHSQGRWPTGKTRQRNEEGAEERAAEMLQRQYTLNELASDIYVKGALFGVIESLAQAVAAHP